MKPLKLQRLEERSTDFLSAMNERKIMRFPKKTYPPIVDPISIAAKDAFFMRPSDWIIGVRIGDQTRCYPAWILDNYHVVNDKLAEAYIAPMHCEVCCTNSVYIAGDTEQERILFGSDALYNATMCVYDFKTSSSWVHTMGVAIDGKKKGCVLPFIESFQATYEEWVSLYPETSVMQWTRPAHHPGERHGHGTRDTFARSGLEKSMTFSMPCAYDDHRLPEHEIGIFINTREAQALLPLRELEKGNGVFELTVGSLNLVSLGSEMGSAMVGTFYRHHPDDPSRLLHCERQGTHVVDTETKSVWRVDGLAIEGPFQGKQLTPLPTTLSKWHSVPGLIPNIPVLEHEGVACPIPLDELKGIVDLLQRENFRVEVKEKIYTLALPDGAIKGFHLTVNNDPFDLILFEDESVAEDYAMCCSHEVQVGPIVMISAPNQYKDALHTSRLVDNKIEWSTLLEEAHFVTSLKKSTEQIEPPAKYPAENIKALCGALTSEGYAIGIVECLPRDAIPSHAIIGIRLKIGTDPFIVYRFTSEQAADVFDMEKAHSLTAGPFVLRSDPDNIYRVPYPVASFRRKDEKINWSKLLESEDFKETLNETVATLKRLPSPIKKICKLRENKLSIFSRYFRIIFFMIAEPQKLIIRRYLEHRKNKK